MLENNQIKQPILLVKAASNKLGKKINMASPPLPHPFLINKQTHKRGKML